MPRGMASCVVTFTDSPGRTVVTCPGLRAVVPTVSWGGQQPSLTSSVKSLI